MTLQHAASKSPTPPQRLQSAHRGPVAVGKFVVPLASQALKSRGTVMASLLAEWPGIAGPSLASFTMPVKLSRGSPAAVEGGKAVGRAASHLVLKVDPVRALDVQYMIPQLIERINRALGYNAVAAIRLMQAPLRQAPQKPRLAKTPAAAPDRTSPPPQPASRLDGALARIAQGIERRKQPAITSA